MLAKARRALRIGMRSPFPDPTATHDLIVHCCHHKVGTVWFHNVLSAVARDFGLRLYRGDQGGLPAEADIFFQDHSRIDRASLRRARGSHIVRDPRDVVVSAYFHHLRTEEPWVLSPSARYEGRSYQEHLRALDREAGITCEIERCAATVIRDMVEWEHAGNGFLELRYEDLLTDEEAGFRKLFCHYGFSPTAVERSTAIALRFSHTRMRGRTKHIRSGRPGEWREHLSEAHLAQLERLTGDAIGRLGYRA